VTGAVEARLTPAIPRVAAESEATGKGAGHFVKRTPEIREVILAPGSRVVVRMPQPPEKPSELSLLVYVVTEPGQPPRVYDTAQTILVSGD
jgi:hypothetical protein